MALQEPARRPGQISHLPLALASAYPLNDLHLELIEMQQDQITPLLGKATARLAEWIIGTEASTKFTGVSSLERFHIVLERHFKELTRGYLGTEDLERAERIAAVHHRYDIDLAWFVLGYRNLQTSVTEALHETGDDLLATALNDLFNWDMGLILSSYQRSLHLDAPSGLIRRQTFLDQVSLDARYRQQNGQKGLLLLLDTVLSGQEEPASHDGTVPVVGAVLQRYQSARTKIGRLGGSFSGMWLDPLPEREITQLKRHIFRSLTVTAEMPELKVTFWVSVLGIDASSFDALYQYGEWKLLQSLSLHQAE